MSQQAVINKLTCPGRSERVILTDCLSSQALEDRSTDWIIAENCRSCKAAIKGFRQG